MHSSIELPTPSPDAQAASHALSDLIRARLQAAGGWMGFADYMELALYAPGLGYYSGGARVFGESGDFLTAPELSADFAQAIARALQPVLRDSDTILEVGAGTGAMARDLLTALQALGGPDVRYQILERSADLRQRQAQRLRDFDVQWLDSLPAAGLQGVILANEVLDALPVTRFRLGADSLMELGVVPVGAGFDWRARQASPAVRESVGLLRATAGGVWPAPYDSEFCPSVTTFVASLAGLLERGLLLICDYGLPAREYYHADRRGGTLRCHYRHRAHSDPFLWPGLQDISAWVDFSAVAIAGQAAGLELQAYTTQAHFLLANGVLDAPPDPDPVRQARRAAALRQLLLPGEMGEKFKVMALGRGLESDALATGRDFSPRL